MDVLADEFVSVFTTNKLVPPGPLHEALARYPLAAHAMVMTAPRAARYFSDLLPARQLVCLQALRGQDEQQSFLARAEWWGRYHWEKPYGGESQALHMFGLYTGDIGGSLNRLPDLGGLELTSYLLTPLVVRRAFERHGPFLSDLSMHREMLESALEG